MFAYRRAASCARRHHVAWRQPAIRKCRGRPTNLAMTMNIRTTRARWRAATSFAASRRWPPGLRRRRRRAGARRRQRSGNVRRFIRDVTDARVFDLAPPWTRIRRLQASIRPTACSSMPRTPVPAEPSGTAASSFRPRFSSSAASMARPASTPSAILAAMKAVRRRRCRRCHRRPARHRPRRRQRRRQPRHRALSKQAAGHARRDARRRAFHQRQSYAPAGAVRDHGAASRAHRQAESRPRTGRHHPHPHRMGTILQRQSGALQEATIRPVRSTGPGSWSGGRRRGRRRHAHVRAASAIFMPGTPQFEVFPVHIC